MGCVCHFSAADSIINNFWDEIDMEIPTPRELAKKISVYVSDDEEYIFKMIELDIIIHNLKNNSLYTPFEIIKKDYLSIENPNKCIIVILILLLIMKNTDSTDIYKSYCEIFKLLSKYITIDPNLLFDVKFFKEIIEYYIFLVSFQTVESLIESGEYPDEFDERPELQYKNVFSLENRQELVKVFFKDFQKNMNIQQFLEKNYHKLHHKSIRNLLFEIHHNKLSKK